jgi:hypothetical protein
MCVHVHAYTCCSSRLCASSQICREDCSLPALTRRVNVGAWVSAIVLSGTFARLHMKAKVSEKERIRPCHCHSQGGYMHACESEHDHHNQCAEECH